MTDQTPQKAELHRHGMVARTFHWGFVAILIYAVIKQVGNLSDLSDPGLLRFEILFAAGFLVLLAARWVYMRFAGPTSVPSDAPPLMRRAAKLGHLAVYGSMATVAISGLMIGALYGAGVTSGPMIGLALGLHEVSVAAIYLTVGLHVAAALFHRLKGDGIWTSMVPVFREKTGKRT